MELTPRKQAVLRAIVKAYIETGEPVGSKNLTLLIKNAPSSATLRNEMSDLCELGLLSQPHTSAGRIPTSAGYKLYVNSLMNQDVLSEKSALLIENAVNTIKSEPESIPKKFAQMLSNLTGLTAFSCLITENMPRIKRVELLPIGKFSLMLLIITDDGRTRQKIFRQGKNFGACLVEQFKNVIDEKVKGKSVETLTKAYMQTLVASCGIAALELMPLFTAVFEAAAEIEKIKIDLSGEEHIYNVCGENTASNVISFFQKSDKVAALFENAKDGANVIFGTDTNYGELLKSAMVVSKFEGKNNHKGYIGVIGSSRMSYEQIMPCIEYTSKKLSQIMTEAQSDMED